jgi:mannose-6-phosphate isomerase-like protein (cupin superfamily)
MKQSPQFPVPDAVLILHPDAGYPRTATKHSFHKMIVVTRGVYQAQCGGKLIELTSCEAVLFPAGVEHQPIRRTDSSPSFICIQWTSTQNFGSQTIVRREPKQRLAVAAS